MEPDKSIWIKIKKSIKKIDEATAKTKESMDKFNEAVESITTTELQEKEEPTKDNWPNDILTIKVNQPWGKNYSATNYYPTSGWSSANDVVYSFDPGAKTGYYDYGYTDEEKHEDKLINTVEKVYYSEVIPPEKYSKYGVAWVSNTSYKSNKCFVWDEDIQEWNSVNFIKFQEYWLAKQEEIYNLNNPWDSNSHISLKSISKPYMPEKINKSVKWDAPVPPEGLDAWDKPVTWPAKYSGKPASKDVIDQLIEAKNSYQNKIKQSDPEITQVKEQKTKPKNPVHGLVWHQKCTYNYYIFNANTDQWNTISATLVDEFLEKKPIVAKTKSTNVDSLYFRTNCGNWHQITKQGQETTKKDDIYESHNGEIKWYYSSESSNKVWNCGHDNQRIVPLFTHEEYKAKVDEINKNQSGNEKGSSWIQTKVGWKEIPNKMTLIIGKNNRRFHHDSSVKVWFMALTLQERNKVSIGTIPDSVKEDMGYIFNHAVPYAGCFSWYSEKVIIHKGKQNNNNDNDEDYLYQYVNNVKANLEMTKKNNKEYKPSPDPNQHSEYNSSDGDWSGYFGYFNCLGDYELSYLRSKAKMIHNYLMTDIKLAMLKKDKKMFNKCIKNLDELQILWDKAETYYIENHNKNGYIKLNVKSQSIYRYLYDNNFGLE